MAGDEAGLRRAIFRRALPLFGRIVSPSQIRDRDPETGYQLHPLMEGIYKPRWSRYAFSIISTLASPYSDQINYLPDRSWWIYYSPKHSRRIASCFHFSGKKERPSICRLIAIIDRTRKPSNGTEKSALVGLPASGTEDSKAAADE
jgi:hypothetical protein